MRNSSCQRHRITHILQRIEPEVMVIRKFVQEPVLEESEAERNTDGLAEELRKCEVRYGRGWVQVFSRWGGFDVIGFWLGGADELGRDVQARVENAHGGSRKESHDPYYGARVALEEHHHWDANHD